ncbi:hypothetical protein PPYR_00679 [Photinus pyralis]|uniref:DUF4806 domain-containing protein n=1 Tax=Photinus pyralis TaxID=7054 RepID=A0A5N4A2Y8_PHOPY|nr:uncharacterized protein LOC116161539 isoform X2 [Photinus pyralis]XP_031357125.1 uncharacterized protein LOC116181000 isoform X2 [Photinus pyralis]KAB0791676.1 hypothetical protein PPYR_03476 [Photinus pyralis]KAB0803709.1 hypothetical protein PPYR_00679 [Photinus pyralis]
MDEETWSVVKFVQENSVEAVPSNWLQPGGKCYFPTYSNIRLQQALQRREEPRKEWPLYDIFLFRNNVYDNFNVAQKKAKKATITSDLESDSTIAIVPPKRKRIIKHFSSFSSVEDEIEHVSSLPPHPQLKVVKKVVQAEVHSVDIDDTSPPAPDNSDKVTKLVESDQNLEGVESNRGMLVKILHKQNIIMALLNAMNERFANMEKKMVLSAEPSVEISDTIFTKFDFPFNVIEALEDFETFINNPAEFNKVLEFSRLGGNVPYNFVARSMEKLFTNQLANNFSYYGRKQKRPFNKLNVNKLVIESGLSIFPTSTRMVFEQSIAKWLRRAKERKDKN